MGKTVLEVKLRANQKVKLIRITCPSCGLGERVPQEDAVRSTYSGLVHRKTSCGYACDD